MSHASICPQPSLSLSSLCSPSCPLYYLAGAHRAPVAVQHPDLPAVLDLVVMDTVTGAVMPVGAPTVVPSLQVEAHCVVGAGVPPCLAFINIYREHKEMTSYICSVQVKLFLCTFEKEIPIKKQLSRL